MWLWFHKWTSNSLFSNERLIYEHSNGLLLNSIFVTGTDTDVGKTYITAGLAVTLRKMNIDVGIMKPFAAGTAQKNGFKSEDVEILANAAQIKDPETLLNPQFFPIAASPYTALKNLKINPSKYLSKIEASRYLKKYNKNDVF